MGDFGFNRPSNNNGGNSGTGDGTNVDLSSYAKKNNPVFQGSISIGRKANSDVGVNSTAMGDNVEASGYASHAEGDNTIASEDYSHAEGYQTISSGYASHAEGTGTEADQEGSHAEGCVTKATGHASHAEGAWTQATGDRSHAEGENTFATGARSHVEGCGTKASGHNQHVQGTYNIEDTEHKYAHIVGNGTLDRQRSNAHTLDWDGNAWFAGQVQGTNLPWSTLEIGDLIIEQTVLFEAQSNGIGLGFTDDIPLTFAEGEKICFTFDNEQYICETRRLDEDNIYIGNGTLDGYDEIHNNEPFGVDFSRYGDEYIVRIYTIEKYAGLEVPVKIEKVTGELHKLDEKYLPDNIATKEYVDGVMANNTSVAGIKEYNMYNTTESIFGKTGIINIEEMETCVRYGMTDFQDCVTFAFVIPTNDAKYRTISITSANELLHYYVSERWTDESGDFIVLRTTYTDYVINVADKSTQNSVTYEINDRIDYLTFNRTKEYVPKTDYNPATKKYVDDKVESINLTDLEVANSISMGRKEGTTIGEKSVALGYDVEASGYNSYAEGYEATASGETSHAEGYSTEASGVNSHAEGSNTTASDYASHAEGNNTEASGYASHAEGTYAKASGDYSHAEGSSTEASGVNSHAEGSYAQAQNNGAHAEGYYTVASGEYSHAEGSQSYATQNSAHAEGAHTQANGKYSHAEGIWTIANGETQHVQGRYNIADTENKYAHIVGNGEYKNGYKYSNAHTLDWEGNAWFSGSVTVGEDNKELATKEYVDGVMASASVNAVNAVSMDYVEGLLARIEALEKTIADLTNNNE